MIAGCELPVSSGEGEPSAPTSPLRHNLATNTSAASHHHARSASSATTTATPPPMVARSSSSSYGGNNNSSYRKSYPRSNNNNSGHPQNNGALPPSMTRGSSSKGYSSRDTNNNTSSSTFAYPSSSYYYSYYPPFPSAVPMDFGYPPSPSAQQSVATPSNGAQQTVPLELIQSWIQGQVEYYFSVENLCRDLYFKQQMDPRHGGVPMTLIAGFNRVKSLLQMARPFCPALLSGAKDETAGQAAVESWLVNDLLELCISASETIHVFKPSQRAPSCVGLRQGWDYWVVRPSPDTPTATTSAATQSAHQPSQDHSTPSTSESLASSGNGLEEICTGHRVSSSMPLSSSVPKYQQQQHPSRSVEEKEQSMPTPPISPHIARI